MSLWQEKKWSQMLIETNQVESIIELWGIIIQKRSIWLKQFGLFIMWVSTDATINKKELIGLCEKEKCVFIQIEYIDYSGNISTTKIEQFPEWYYKKFITPYTAIINLEMSKDDILATMKPKWRYNIKLARKKWVMVEKVEKTDENIKKYYELSVETTSRDNFSGHSLEYYKIFLNTLKNSELFLASVEWEVIAGWIFIFDIDVSYYYYWASTSKKEYRNLMAPYILQRTAIEHAKSIDSKIYDFLWIAWEWEYHDASLAWVTDFKMKLTPVALKVSDSYVYINKKIMYFIIMHIKKIKSYLK